MRQDVQKIILQIRRRWKKRKTKVISILLAIIWLAVMVVLLTNWRMFGRTANGDSIKRIVQWVLLWLFGVAGAILWQFYCLFLRKKRKIKRLGVGSIVVLAIAKIGRAHV